MHIHELPETRLRFFVPRLAVSLVLIAVFWGVVRMLWYPGYYYELSGTAWLILVAAAFAILVGPMLTTALYRRDKQGMWNDIVVLAVVEVIALGIACNALYERRPAFLVFTVDRFEIVSPAEVDTTRIVYPELSQGGIETLVAARLPNDSELAQPIVDDILFNGGVDIDRRPALWEPYEYSAREAASRARPLADLQGADAADQVQNWLDNQGEPAYKFGFLPIRGLKGDAALVVNESGFPMTILGTDPWQD